MTRNLLGLATLVGIFFLSSCAGSKPVEVEKVEPQRDRMVARVASVNIAANYVLIQRLGRLVVPEDSILYTLGTNTAEGNNSPASIKVTGERLGQFLAADIMSGKLVVGDAVYLRTFEKENASDSQ